jgi:aldehyde dehydrogenase (NAD+)
MNIPFVSAENAFGGGAASQTNFFVHWDDAVTRVGSFGIGNYYGKYGFDSLTHATSILVSPSNIAIDHLHHGKGARTQPVL